MNTRLQVRAEQAAAATPGLEWVSAAGQALIAEAKLLPNLSGLVRFSHDELRALASCMTRHLGIKA